MAKSLELSENNFSKTAIKTYKELNENYFPELEEAVNKFRKKVNFESKPPIKFKEIRGIILDEFEKGNVKGYVGSPEVKS